MRTVGVAEVATEIAASPRRVWEVLTDFPRYPEWTTYIREIEATLEVGSPLRLVVSPTGRRPIVARTSVLDATPEVRLAWAAVIPGAAWLPATVFSGVHEFVLSARPDGGTTLVHCEYFSGLLARTAGKAVRGVDQDFEAFNEALKHRAEEVAVGGD